MIEEHHEADDEENQTNGHEELFAVMTGHAVFTIDGEEIDAPAGTIVFVRDPALLRHARAIADGTAIFMVGGPVGVPYTVSLGIWRSRNRAKSAHPGAPAESWFQTCRGCLARLDRPAVWGLCSFLASTPDLRRPETAHDRAGLQCSLGERAPGLRRNAGWDSNRRPACPSPQPAPLLAPDTPAETRSI